MKDERFVKMKINERFVCYHTQNQDIQKQLTYLYYQVSYQVYVNIQSTAVTLAFFIQQMWDVVSHKRLTLHFFKALSNIKHFRLIVFILVYTFCERKNF